MKYKFFLIGILCVSLFAHADEGMWLLSHMNRSTKRTMKEMGLKMKVNKIYNSSQPSLKDAVVSFGGFCSGVVVSSDGLVFTNHHCGLNSVQQHSSATNNYLENGFVARSLKEELPNPDLFVRFLIYSKDVTSRVLKVVKPSMTEQQRTQAVDSIKLVITHEVSKKDSSMVGIVDAYYGGSEFVLSVYRDYTDVRLVFAPPSSIGQFGWDTDNWVWPRHTGDFCVFRIYANKNNRPADYSTANIPYHPSYYVPISLKGYDEGTFCMTMGYPGMTERYLSSFGINEMMHNQHQAMIDVRGIKQAIWKEAMNVSNIVRIKYSSKYSESSNYWKNSIGMNKAIKQLGIIEERQKEEAALKRWMVKTKSEQKNLNILAELESKYKEEANTNRAMYYFVEALLNGPELLQLSYQIMNFDFRADEKQVLSGIEDIKEKYKNYDKDLDKKVFKALTKEYISAVDSSYLPDTFKNISKKYKSIDEYIDSLYIKSDLTSIKGLQHFMEPDTTYNLMKDPAIELTIDLVVKYLDMEYSIRGASDTIEKDERLLTTAIRRMYANRHFYPDANSTMRLSYGTVCSYIPQDGIKYNYYTTAKGILEKVKSHPDDHDFSIKPELLKLIKNNDYGRYADKKGSLDVCFISNNDINGGNSGSAMFNGKGELIGLAFDGNWEAMSSDLKYNPQLQRCIGVDIRYVLFLIEKYGKAGDLIKELQIN